MRLPTVTGVPRLDLAVVGGGAIGAACARALAARGLAVALFEPGPAAGAASPASAGLLAAQIEPGDDVWLALAVRARDRFATLSTDLLNTTGIDIGVRRMGIATLAFTPDHARTLAADAERQRSAGLRAEWLPATAVRRRWPGTAPDCEGALFSPDDGAVDAPALTLALLADAVRLGARVVPERVDGIVHASGRITGVATAHGTMSVRHVVIAAGAWSATLRGLPRALLVTPVRGQLVATSWPSGLPPAALYHDHGYVVCRGAQAIMGSTMENVGFDAAVTSSAQAQIVARARRLVPALGAPERHWAGLRPLTPDGLPILGPDPDVDGLWYATGHGRNGILLAPLTGDILGDLITTGATDVDLAPLAVDRFAAFTHHSPRTTPLS